MNCRDIEPLLLAERDGVLTMKQHAFLDGHVAICPACQKLRARVNEATNAFKDDAAGVSTPDIEKEWEKLQAQLQNRPAKPARKRPLAPIVWFATPLAAAAAITLAYFGLQTPSKPVPAVSPAPEVAQAIFVEATDVNASTMVYVDKESGWLVVWATDGGASTKS